MNKTQRFYTLPEKHVQALKTGVIFNSRFYQLEIERFRSRLFHAEDFRAIAEREHIQSHYHIVLYTDGDGAWLNNGQLHHAPENTLLVISPDQSHMVQACIRKTYRVMILTFRYRHNNEFLKQSFSKLSELYTGVKMPDVPSSMLLSRTTKIQLEYRMESLMDALLKNNKCRQLDIITCFNEMIRDIILFPQDRQLDNKEHSSDYIWEIKHQIETTPEKEFTIENMAKTACMCKEHFIRSFKKRYNVSPGQFILMNRMKKAAELLVNSNLRIQEISSRIGINSIYYFSRLFKKHYRLPPTEYRRKFNYSD